MAIVCTKVSFENNALLTCETMKSKAHMKSSVDGYDANVITAKKENINASREGFGAPMKKQLKLISMTIYAWETPGGDTAQQP